MAILTALGDATGASRDVPIAAPPQMEGFEFLEELGRGGMGVVYKARDVELKRLVAVKLIHGGLRTQEEVWARARTEAEAVAQLQHPRFVQIFKIGGHEGQPYLVLEYVDGGNLAQHLASGPFVPKRAAELVRQLAVAIHDAHRKNIVHRDLKPANVLMDAAGSPKITDFGLAKLLNEQGTTRSGVLVGTPNYMAPEQVDKEAGQIGPRTDVYALGAILYETLTGHPPFQGATPFDTIKQVRTHEPVPIRRVQPSVPRDLETICLKCLRKEPAKRYADAKSLAEDVARFLEGKPIQARPVGLLERLWKWVKRSPFRAAGLLLLATVLYVGVAVVSWYVNKRQETQQAVQAALYECDFLTKQKKWSESIAVVKRAREILKRGFGSEEHRREIEVRTAELTLAYSLEQARRHDIAVRFDENRFDYDPVFTAWRAIFADFGVTVFDAPTEQAVARFQGCSPSVREHVVEILDLWIVWVDRKKHAKQLKWLQHVVGSLDDDGWRGEMRAAIGNADVEALQKLADRVKVSGQTPGHLLVAGHGLMSLGEFREALGLLRRTQSEYPDHFSANYGLGSMLALVRPPRYHEATVYMTAAAALHPRHAGVYQSLGYFAFKQGKFDNAMRRCRKALALKPNYASAHLYLGRTLIAKGDLTAAVQALTKAVTLRPEMMQAHYYLGRVREKQSEWKQAAAAYDRAVALRPEMATLHQQLAMSLWKTGAFSRALTHMQKAHQLGSQQKKGRQPTAQFIRVLTKLVQMEKKLDDVLQKKTSQPPRRVCIMQKSAVTNNAMSMRPSCIDRPSPHNHSWAFGNWDPARKPRPRPCRRRVW